MIIKPNQNNIKKTGAILLVIDKFLDMYHADLPLDCSSFRQQTTDIKQVYSYFQVKKCVTLYSIQKCMVPTTLLCQYLQFSYLFTLFSDLVIFF